MKTTMKFLFAKSGIFAVLFLSILNVSAQTNYFTASTISDNSYSSSSGVTNTGIDNLISSDVTYELCVWDGASPGFGYYVDYGTGLVSGDNNLAYSDALNPDIVLMRRTCSSTAIFGLIVYYSTDAGGIVFELGSFNPVTYVYSYISDVLINNSTYGTEVNIDRNEANHFVITWDNAANEIFYITGYMDCSSSYQPELDINSCGPVELNSSLTASMPDVALYYDNTTGNEHAIFTFVDESGGGDLLVSDEDYDDLENCSPQVTPSSIATPTSGYSFYHPRVATASAGTWETPWTVTAEENDGNYYFINVWSNTYSSGIVSRVFNDGNTTDNSPFDITEVANVGPVVAYSDDLDDALFVGWTFKNEDDLMQYSNNGARDANYPIVPGPATFDGVLDPQSTYWEVPRTISTPSYDDYGVLSIACTYNLSLAFYNVDDSKVYAKRAYPNTTHLRLSSLAKSGVIIYPNPGSGQFSIAGITASGIIEVRNMLGEIIHWQKISAPKAEVNLGRQDKGVYFLTLTDKNQTLNEKIVITR